VDPALQELIAEGAPDDEVAVLLRLSDSTAAPPHARLVAQFGNIATCRLRRADIVAARASAPVISMKAARLYGPSGTEEDYWADELDASGSSSIKDPTAATHTAENKPIIEYASSDGEASLSNRVQNSDIRRPENVNLPTGKGAVVAHIDWGVDITHPDFRLPDGRTRLLALWDQRGAAFPDLPNRYGYGRIFGRAEINRALLSGDPYGALGYHPADFDTLRGTHGTHTLSIAAGNGRSGGPSGIAPDADLIFVHLSTYTAEGPTDLGDSVAYFEAIDFVLRTASASLPIETSNAWNGTLGDDVLEANSDATRTILRPVVINSSLGRHGGSHVGLTLVEQGLDAALRESPGRAFVHSTGNYYNRRTHASGTLRPGEVHTLQILVEGGSRNNSETLSPSEIEIWYPGTDRLAVSVTAPNGTRFEPVRGDQQSKLFLQLPNETSPRVIGHLYHRLNDPNNGDNEAVLFLYKGAPVGTYDITLSGEDIADGRYHLWIERNTAGQRAQAKFEANDSRVQFTTGTICNGFRTIAVGAYDAHAWYQNGDIPKTGRPLAPFSSSGPTRDGRQKPDLCAPGVNVLAARSSPRDWSGKAEGQPPPLLTRMSGTSMAAPHVTGTIALMFEAANRLLTIEETRRLLLLSTDSPPADSTDSARLRIGSGFLNIEAAITATRGFLKTSGRDDRVPVKAIQSNVYVPATENVLPFQETLQPMNPSYETNEVEAVEAEVDGFYPEYYPEYYPETDENGNDVEAARDDRQQPQRARSRRNGDSPSFGFVLPLGGNGGITPALSVPIGGRQSPFSVAIPLGGTNPPSPSPPPNNSPPGQAPAPSTPNPYANPYADPGMFTAPMGDPYIDPMLSTGGYTPAIPVGVDDPTALPLIDADEFVAAGSDKSITPMVEWSEWDESSDQTFGEQISNVFYESDTDEFESDESEEAFGERIASVADILAADPQARSFRSSAHLATLLDAIGQAQTLSPLGMVSGGHRPSASELYNAFVHGDTALRSRHRFHEHYAHRFLPVAMPGSRLQAMDLRPGDVVVRVARGENWGQFSIIASPRLLSSSELGGSPLGGYVPGGYAPVIECLPVPRLRQDNFVRRLTGTDGKTLPDTLILRVRRSFGEDWNAETENGGPLFRDGARPVVLARGASGTAVRQVQAILNRYSLQELEAGRLTLDGCPLEEDGKFGALMQRAVRDFQMRQFADDASQWDGIVGARTWGKLNQLTEGNRDLPPVIAKADRLMEADNAPTRSDSARMEWQDLSKVRGHDGVDHLYYLTTGNSEGLATFNLRVTNTNDHYNFNNVVLKIRLSKKLADGTFMTILLRGQKGNYKSIPSQSIADESSRIIPIQIERQTLIEAYNADPDSPFTRLEVEFHWAEGATDRFASYYYNRTSLSFYLVKPFEFLFNTKKLVRRVALNDSQYRQYWTGIWEHEFTAGDKTPVKLAFTIQTALSGSGTDEITLSKSTTETKGVQRGLETSFTSSTKASLGVGDTVKIGLEQQESLSVKASIVSSESVARQFSESLRSSRTFTESFTKSIQINSEITPAAPGTIKKVYLYPVFNLYKLKLVRFEGPNSLGQATQRKEFDSVPILLFSNWGDKQVQTKPGVKQRRKVDDTEADGWAEGITHTADLADSFFAAMRTVATTLQTQPQFLLAVMNSESGIRASAHNPNGHASGLIQFMPDTLRRLGWTQGHEAFRRLTATEQMPFVLQYYLPFVRQGLNSTARLYQATFLPATLSRGSEPDTVIVDVNNNDNAFAYAPNRGLDRRSDGRILVGDLTAFVERAKGTPRWYEASERLRSFTSSPIIAPESTSKIYDGHPSALNDSFESQFDIASAAETVPSATAGMRDIEDYISLDYVLETLTGSASSVFTLNPAFRDLRQLGATLGTALSVLLGGPVRTDPVDATKFQTRIRMQLAFPATVDNPSRPSGRQRLPLAVLVHGNHEAYFPTAGGFDEKASFRGYRYLQEDLARQGIASISVDTNMANQLGSLIELRADMVLEAIKLLQRRASTAGDLLFNRIDFTRIALMGHSRGGDAVVRVVKKNFASSPAQRFGIRTVCSLAPTDFTGGQTPANRMFIDSNELGFYTVLYGALDGDVSGKGGSRAACGTGFRHYDRARCEKALVFVEGCCHNSFNSIWHRDGLDYGVDPDDVTSSRLANESKHQTLAKEYIGGQFAWHLKGVTARSGLFNGTTASITGLRSVLLWGFGATFQHIDDFENPAANIAGGTRSLNGGARLRDFESIMINGRSINDNVLEQSKVIHADTTVTGLRSPFGVETTLPPGRRDLRSFTTLALDVGAFFDTTSPATIAAGVSPTFSVFLRDASGATARVDGSRFSPAIGKPFFHNINIGGRSGGRENVTALRLETLRVPLSQFNGIDLRNIEKIQVEVSPPNGHLFIDDIKLASF
jgi:subtilisin family serine protease